MPDASHAGEPPEWRRAGRRLRHPLRGYRRTGPGAASDHVVVRLSGEVTSRTPRVGRRLRLVLRMHPAVLEIDLVDVTYLSPDGGAAVFMALREAKVRGTEVITTHTRRQAVGALK
jgi:hypothetical protein